MSRKAALDRKAIEKFNSYWEDLMEEFPEARAKAVKAMGQAVKRDLDARPGGRRQGNGPVLAGIAPGQSRRLRRPVGAKREALGGKAQKLARSGRHHQAGNQVVGAGPRCAKACTGQQQEVESCGPLRSEHGHWSALCEGPDVLFLDQNESPGTRSGCCQ